jgi:hypothetical protein
MFFPSMRISPVIRTPSIKSFILFRQRSKVDFPQPEGPIKAVMVFSLKKEVTFFKA